MKRIITTYIIREIAALFVLGIVIFTLILLMGRLIKLTDLVISRGVAITEVARMILYLMPSFLIYTIPMAFLLAVLLAFGRLSADNEITVLKAGGISLLQLMPPVVFCGVVATLITFSAGSIGVPWGNTAFRQLSFELLKQNVAVTIREKVFWDDIPGIVLYTDRYSEETRTLSGVIIHDGRDPKRPMTIFAADGALSGGSAGGDIRLVLKNGSIHSGGRGDAYHLVFFGEYIMTIAGSGNRGAAGRNELDMGIDELRRGGADPATDKGQRLKMLAELQSRFAFPVASLVFAVLAVPLGMQNRRSGKSAGFSLSIAILLSYYILMSLVRTLAEKGTLPAVVALWIPNLLFLAVGWYLLRLASLERSLSPATLLQALPFGRRGH